MWHNLTRLLAAVALARTAPPAVVHEFRAPEVLRADHTQAAAIMLD